MAFYPEHYVRLCHKKAILQDLMRYLRERVPESAHELPEIFCEDLPYSDRQVHTESVTLYLEQLGREAEQVQTEIDSYTVTKHDQG